MPISTASPLYEEEDGLLVEVAVSVSLFPLKKK
jgi:hypothetical protein